MQKYELKNGIIIEVGMQDLSRMVVPVTYAETTSEYDIVADSEGDLGFWFGEHFVYFHDL